MFRGQKFLRRIAIFIRSQNLQTHLFMLQKSTVSEGRLASRPYEITKPYYRPLNTICCVVRPGRDGHGRWR